MKSGDSGTSSFMITNQLYIPKKSLNTLFSVGFRLIIGSSYIILENMNLLFMLERVDMYQGKQSL